ncbi:glycosyltransferase family 4 protein [Candidatus Peregrinibacteria bacterium]|nr:glycosyltransferase family 4 protein [Candidatus Peregrinibacteria bacterium]
MNILFVTEYYWPHLGGVELVFQKLAEGLARKGHRVTVVTIKLKNTKKKEVINGVNISRVSVPSFANRYFFTFFSIGQVWNLAKKADIIHATLYNAAFPTWIVSVLQKKKSVLTVHEVFGKRWTELFDTSYLFAKMHQCIEWIILLLPFHKYVCVSKSTLNDLKKYVEERKVETIYNGIDYELFDSLKYDKEKSRKKIGLENKFLYVYFGRPGISKGLEYLIKAVPIIQKKKPDAHLLLLLAKEPQSRYEKILELIEKLQIKNMVTLKEPVERKNLPSYIKAADCVVIPSLAEGFGFSAAESSAMEAVTVVSDTSSLPEVVYGKVIFVEPKNVEAIANGVMKAHEGKYEMIPKKKMTWEECIAKHEALYKNM